MKQPQISLGTWRMTALYTCRIRRRTRRGLSSGRRPPSRRLRVSCGHSCCRNGGTAADAVRSSNGKTLRTVWSNRRRQTRKSASRPASPRPNRPRRFRRYCIRRPPAPQPFWPAVGVQGAPQKSGTSSAKGCHGLLVKPCAAPQPHRLTSNRWHSWTLPLFCGAPGVRTARGRASATP
jgi:hypothetical protein